MPKFPEAKPTSYVDRLMVAASARLNYEWALRRPGRPPFLMLTEFPRSGGNWVRDMLGDAMQMPVPRFARFPVTFRAIVHNHDHRPTAHPTVYVVRDPRDVFISHFFKTVSAWLDASPSQRRRLGAIHPSMVGVGRFDDANEDIMVKFYEEWQSRGVGVRTSWKAHVRAFLQERRENVTVIRYEALRHSAVSALSQAVTDIVGRPPLEDDIKFAVMRNEFNRQAGRAAGVTDNRSTKRQGVVGGWRKDLPPGLAARFISDSGEEMALAGYSADE